MVLIYNSFPGIKNLSLDPENLSHSICIPGGHSFSKSIPKARTDGSTIDILAKLDGVQ